MRFSARLVFSAAAWLVLACDSGPAPVTCYGIPDGGCPNEGTDTCIDPTCAAVYDCLADGGWGLDYTCPVREGGAMDAPVTDSMPSDAGYDVDAPPGAFGGPGCVDLQTPDCPLGTVLVCGGGCCGCQDLYVCDDGGWDIWGQCTDAGPVMN